MATQHLSPEEVTEFLQTPMLNAIVGTVAADGSAQLSPVWYVYDPPRMFISIPASSAKHRNLKRDPRISVCVDGGRKDVRAVMLYGRADLREGDEAHRWRIIRAYYATEEEARAYLDSVKEVPHRLVVLEPDRIVSQDFRG